MPLKSISAPGDVQREIRQLISDFALNRQTFANELGFTKRALDSWLLPSSSKGFRAIGPEEIRRIREWGELKLREQKNRMRKGLTPSRPVSSRRSKTLFPAIFRLHYRSHMRFAGRGVIERVEYSFSPAGLDSVKFPEDLWDLRSEEVRYIRTSDTPLLDERTWLFIQEVESLDLLSGYEQAIFTTQPSSICDSVCSCIYGERYFVLHRSYKPFGAIDGVITHYGTSDEEIILNGAGRRVSWPWDDGE